MANKYESVDAEAAQALTTEKSFAFIDVRRGWESCKLLLLLPFTAARHAVASARTSTARKLQHQHCCHCRRPPCCFIFDTSSCCG